MSEFTVNIITSSVEFMTEKYTHCKEAHLFHLGVETTIKTDFTTSSNIFLDILTDAVAASSEDEHYHSDSDIPEVLTTPDNKKWFQRIGPNGKLPDTILKPIGGGFKLRADAADRWLQMKEAAAADGVKLNVISAYRTLSQQQGVAAKYKNEKGRAAKVGNSPHGWGVAVDIQIPGGNTNPSAWKSKERVWIQTNGRKYGWHGPPRLDQFSGATRPEAWHFEYFA